MRCPRCGLTKDEDEFPRNRSSRSGRHSYCKPCHNSVVKANRAQRHGSSANYFSKLRYGIDLDEMDALVRAQGGKCPLCLRAEPKHIDHCHSTGKVRGVLCFNCNGGLGRFEDDPDVMLRAIDYLHAHGKPDRGGAG